MTDELPRFSSLPSALESLCLVMARDGVYEKLPPAVLPIALFYCGAVAAVSIIEEGDADKERALREALHTFRMEFAVHLMKARGESEEPQ